MTTDAGDTRDLLWSYETAERLDRMRVRGMWIAYLGLVSPLATMPLMAIPFAAGGFGSAPPQSLGLQILTVVVLLLFVASLVAFIPCFVVGSLLRAGSAWQLHRHLRANPCRYHPPPVTGERFGDWRVIEARTDTIHMRRVMPAVVGLIVICLAASFFVSAAAQLFLSSLRWSAIPLGAIAVLIPCGALLGFVRNPIEWTLEQHGHSPAELTITTLSGSLRRHQVVVSAITGWRVADDSLWLLSRAGRFAVATVGSGTLGQMRAVRIMAHLMRCGLLYEPAGHGPR